MRRWTPEEWAKAIQLSVDLTCADIAQELGFTEAQVRNRFDNEYYVGRHKGPFPVDARTRLPQRKSSVFIAPDEDGILRPSQVDRFDQPLKVSPAALADRDRRNDLRMRQSMTAAFFGDPPPGYSALDRKQNTQAAQP